jgi:hypothetical protein
MRFRGRAVLLLLLVQPCEFTAKLENHTPALPAFALSFISGAQLQASLPISNHRACTDRQPI